MSGGFYWDEPVADATEVSDYLEGGYVVDYQPGDGTRYEVELVRSVHSNGYTPQREYLILRNFGHAAIHISEKRIGFLEPVEWDLVKYVTNPTLPSGMWQALRPLLAAFKCAKGEPVMDRGDARREADIRTREFRDREPLGIKDAALGRKVRRLLEEDSGGTPAPEPSTWADGVGDDD